MSKRILNITNGDAFNQYFISIFDRDALPFRETMMEGNTAVNIFSDEFINVRAAEHKVSIEEYKENMLICNALQSNDYKELRLWFGKDTFCQMNLLTLLAYLEQIEYGGEVLLNYIDDETFDTVESNIAVELGVYNSIYREIFVEKQKPHNLGVLSQKAIELYFDYLSENGTLSKIARENSDKDEMDVLVLLLESSKEYGLSDVQVKKLIKRIKNMKRVCNFLKEAEIYYLATVEGDQPRVRPFGTINEFEGRLYIQTGKAKPTSHQLAANPKAELCAFKNGAWIRVACELVEDDRFEAKKSMLDAYPNLRHMYDENDGNTQVFYMKNAKATISSFGGAPVEIEF